MNKFLSDVLTGKDNLTFEVGSAVKILLAPAAESELEEAAG